MLEGESRVIRVKIWNNEVAAPRKFTARHVNVNVAGILWFTSREIVMILMLRIPKHLGGVVHM